ncbi:MULTISPECIES: hypothetical protein [unclassified Paraburkholderia]|uniref:hypothetical protein n=1 Tax=unclassified Paraburkholderia TaxID=2615204 RepID=UPI002AB26794|nr:MULTISPECIES: hypothetical protein [unclassified Paraburkholderia]
MATQQIDALFAFELKERILAALALHLNSRTDELRRSINAMCRALYEATGEVFSCGQFVKVA